MSLHGGSREGNLRVKNCTDLHRSYPRSVRIYSMELANVVKGSIDNNVRRLFAGNEPLGGVLDSYKLTNQRVHGFAKTIKCYGPWQLSGRSEV